MKTVSITGWHEGFNKVALSRLLRDKAGFGLSSAKHAVDGLLIGEPIVIDIEHALDFCKEVEAIGATCSLIEQLPSE